MIQKKFLKKKNLSQVIEVKKKKIKKLFLAKIIKMK